MYHTVLLGNFNIVLMKAKPRKPVNIFVKPGNFVCNAANFVLYNLKDFRKSFFTSVLEFLYRY